MSVNQYVVDEGRSECKCTAGCDVVGMTSALKLDCWITERVVNMLVA